MLGSNPWLLRFRHWQSIGNTLLTTNKTLILIKKQVCLSQVLKNVFFLQYFFFNRTRINPKYWIWIRKEWMRMRNPDSHLTNDLNARKEEPEWRAVCGKLSRPEDGQGSSSAPPAQYKPFYIQFLQCSWRDSGKKTRLNYNILTWIDKTRFIKNFYF